MLKLKNILKKDVNIRIDKIITWVLSLIILDRSFTGKKPPEEIKEKAKFNESKDLIEKRFKIIKIKSVIPEYKRKILVACLNTSDLLNEI